MKNLRRNNPSYQLLKKVKNGHKEAAKHNDFAFSATREKFISAIVGATGVKFNVKFGLLMDY